MIITLTGENQYGIRETVNQLVGDFVTQYGANGVERVDGETFDPRQLNSLLQSVSLFAPERLVVLKGAAQNKPLWEALANIEQTSATVVIVEPTMDKRSRTYKMLKAKSDFRDFGAAASNELVSWVIEKANALGATMSPKMSQFLVERVGIDQWHLANEVEKLASAGSAVTRELIIELVEPNPEANAFALLDAAMVGNVQQVSAMVDQLKTQEDPYKLFGLVASQVHTLAVVAVAERRSPDAIAKEAGLHPFVVRKTVGIAKRLGRPRIAQVVADVARCDEQLKSTSIDPWDLLRLCLQKVASRR